MINNSGNCKAKSELNAGLTNPNPAALNKYSITEVAQTLEQLIDSVALVELSSNTQRSPSNQENSVQHNKTSIARTASPIIDGIDLNHANTQPCTDQTDSAIVGRHVSLSPDEISGDLVIDSDLPSSAGQQETSDETEHAGWCSFQPGLSSGPDIVALKNLEITPPPPVITEDKTENKSAKVSKTEQSMTPAQRSVKRKKSPIPSSSIQNLDDSSKSGSRSKRQRTQTKLFQAGDASFAEDSEVSASSSKKPATAKPQAPRPRRSTTQSPKQKEQSTAPSPDSTLRTEDPQDVIFYEKNDYLAIRNEENTYYLCQLMENVRSNRPMIKVKWLDTSDGGKTYFLTNQYDKIPQKSIIMPVTPNTLKSGKKGEQLYALDDQVKDNITERLKRSISIVPPQFDSSQETVVDGS